MERTQLLNDTKDRASLFTRNPTAQLLKNRQIQHIVKTPTQSQTQIATALQHVHIPRPLLPRLQTLLGPRHPLRLLQKPRPDHVAHRL